MKSKFGIFGIAGRAVLVVALAGLALACSRQKLSFDDLRQRYMDQATGGASVDLTDSIILKRFAAQDEGVQKEWETMNKAADRTFLWNDRSCIDDSLSPWRPTSVTTPIGRLAHMAQAYATPASKFYKNDSLKKDVIDGMEWMYANKYSPEHPAYGNWWDWIIGMPYSMNRIIASLYDELTPEQRAKYIEAIDFYAPGVEYEGAATGANKVWQCYSMIVRGILAQDEAKIKMGVDGLGTEFKYVDTGDGFYEDGSFVQHGWIPYTGGYGNGMLADLTTISSLLHGSQWQLPEQYSDMLGSWVENAYLPLVYKGAFMDMARGREITRVTDHSTGRSILMSAYKVAKIAKPEVRDRVMGIVKYNILADTLCDFVATAVPTELIPEVRAFLADSTIAAVDPAPYYKQFAMMDREVFAAPRFALGLALSSSRIQNYETLDSENKGAWHTGDGMTYIYNGDLAQYGDDYWYTVNRYRLPGITVDAQQTHKVQNYEFGKGVLYVDGYKSPHAWVGGASLADCGMAGMWFKDELSTLEAKKSWLMAGEEVVALGAGINSSDNRTIETIVDTRKLSPGKPYSVLVEGREVLAAGGETAPVVASWAYLQGPDASYSVGYYFPDKAPVKLLRETRKGRSIEVTKYGDEAERVRDYVSVWFDHGKNPKNATYCYVLLPGATAEQTRAYAEKNSVTVLANTPQAQAATIPGVGVTGVNFWEAGQVPALQGDAGQGTISSSAPASVIVRSKGGELEVGVSDPTQLQKEPVTVGLPMSVSAVSVGNPDVEVVSMSPLTLKVKVDGGMGRTRVVKFKQ